MRELMLLAVCAFLLTGCTSTRSMMITDDTALITVVGQSENDRARIIDEALAEAARATRAHGYRYFVILDAADASERGARTDPGLTIARQNITPRSFGGPNANPIYSPAANFTTTGRRAQYVRLGLDVTIRMYREGDVNPATQGVWNTDVILGSAAAAK